MLKVFKCCIDMNKHINIGLLLIVCYLSFSCSSPKNIQYFQDLPDSTDTVVSKAAFVDPKIKPDDVLSITIQTTDPQANQVVNQKLDDINVLATSSATNLGPQGVSGYLVDKNGEIELPLLGKVKVGGLSTFEARTLIRQKAESFIVKPNVQVRFVNFKVTVVGEVTKPATYAFQSEKVSILDAIGMAGDLTIYGKRENVLLVRDAPEGKQMIRFNLNKSNIFKSPYFYLRQNDVVYIEPSEAKIATTDAARTKNLTIIASVISLLVVVASRLF